MTAGVHILIINHNFIIWRGFHNPDAISFWRGSKLSGFNHLDINYLRPNTHRVVEIVPTVTRPGVLRLFSRQTTKENVNKKQCWPLFTCGRPKTLLCTPWSSNAHSNKNRHLISPHTEVDDKIEWAHSQFNHLLPLVLLRLEDPQSRRLNEHTALWLAH